MNITGVTKSPSLRQENVLWPQSLIADVPEAYFIEKAGIVPTAFIGLLGNLLALVVWMAETRYNATT